jgi:uncharacterized repeat protein (TIGR02543 family)
LNDTAKVGVWNIQLGVKYPSGWDWSTGTERIAYFSVSDLTLTVNADGSGSADKAPNQDSYSYGDIVNLTATPDLGWGFDHWSGDLSGSDNPASIVMDGNKSVTAHFVQNQYVLNVDITGNGVVVKDPDQLYYTYGNIVNLTASASSGWVFDHWEEDISGSITPTSITIDGNKNVTAVFVESLYILTVNIDGAGTVDTIPSGPYNFGDIVNLTALPAIGSTFNCWTGDLTGSDNPIDIVMDSNKTVTAHFIQNVYILTINIIGDGSVLKNPAQDNYTYATLVELTAIAGAGSIFDHWSGNLTGNSNPATINMTEDANITAHFILSNNGNGGHGTDDGGGGNGGGIGPSYVKINKPPVANLSAGESYIGFVGEEIEFNGSLSYDLDGKIVEYLWDFGDGTTGYGEIETHNYSSPGEYKVTLKVKDNDGAYGTDETIATVVQPNRPPSKPNISGPSEGLIDVEYNYSIVSNDEDNDQIKYTIDWGDGTSNVSDFMPAGEVFITKHKWAETGNYTINVSADDGEAISTNNMTISIHEPKIPTIPQENNICLIFLASLGLLLLVLFLLLSKRERDKKKNK